MFSRWTLNAYLNIFPLGLFWIVSSWAMNVDDFLRGLKHFSEQLVIFAIFLLGTTCWLRHNAINDNFILFSFFSCLDHNYTVLCLSIKELNSQAVNLSHLHTLVSDWAYILSLLYKMVVLRKEAMLVVWTSCPLTTLKTCRKFSHVNNAEVFNPMLLQTSVSSLQESNIQFWQFILLLHLSPCFFT